MVGGTLQGTCLLREQHPRKSERGGMRSRVKTLEPGSASDGFPARCRNIHTGGAAIVSTKQDIRDNKHFAANLRRRLESTHSEGTTLRSMLDRLTDDEIVERYLANEKQGREHTAKRAERAEELESPAYLRTFADSQRQS
jgi:hypothetical protein